MAKLSEVIQVIKNLNQNLPTMIDPIVETIAKEALEEFKASWPNSSGESSKDWRLYKATEGHYQIINDAVYAPYVHLKGETEPLFSSVFAPTLEQKYIPELEKRLILFLESEIERITQ